MKIDEYTRLDATALAALVARGEISPGELLETAASAMEQVNPQLHAVIRPMVERARKVVATGLPDGPFTGVPFLLKDMVEVEGERVTYGAVLTRHYRAKRTCELVKRYERAGLQFLGWTNMSELGLLPTTEPAFHGPTHNPFSLAHSPGGSSGGAAAMVAARAFPAAHGADGGGSIRIPASACGVFGLKPSRGRHPTDANDDPDGFVSHHVITRSVRDSAALLDAICAPQLAKRWPLAAPKEPFARAVEREPSGLRIAFCTETLMGQPAHPDCRAAVEHTARLCESLGHHVEEASPEIDGRSYFEGFAILWGMAAGFFLRALRANIAKAGAPPPLAHILERPLPFKAFSWGYAAVAGHAPLERFSRLLAKENASRTPADLWLAWTWMQAAGDVLTEFLSRYDLQLTPVLGEPPWPTGHLRAGSLRMGRSREELFEQLYRYAGYTPISNTTGLPAMSVPLYWNTQGLPIGVQFIAPSGREDRLFSLAAQLEQAQPWEDRRPHICAH
ncbi:MAG: amidase [Deltaproteobacteria bacterium]|nr:amidase [Deltaproteobacteria bacterium]